MKSKVRLGWATEERARADAATLNAGILDEAERITVRQLSDESWALCWPNGEVRGRYGLIHPTEVAWR